MNAICVYGIKKGTTNVVSYYFAELDSINVLWKSWKNCSRVFPNGNRFNFVKILGITNCEFSIDAGD